MTISRDWLLKMAEAEDAAGCVSVGGLAVEFGFYERPKMSVRAKFKVESVLQTLNGHTVQLQPVVSGSEENKTFYKYTPSGKIELSTINVAVAEQFVPGKEFYVDFAPAE